MLDTVVLLIPQEDFRVMKFDAFSPSAQGLFAYPYYKLSGGYFNCVQNPTTKEMREGNYKPRLTLSKRIVQCGFSVTLKIEFSAPKLLFGNNFDELETKDFNKVLTVLHRKLKEMYIDIDKEKLKYAQVTGIHYGKNIKIEDASASLIINTIQKLDISKRLDAGSTDFRNNGHAIRYHTNSCELTFYDKMKDLQQAKISEKRAIEKDNHVQLSLFNQQRIIKNEVLRMEVRLNTKKKIKEMLMESGCNPKATTFQSLFHKEISKRVLNHFWEKHITSSLNIVLLEQETPEELFYKAKSVGLNDNKALQVIGSLQLINSKGIRALKTIMQPQNFYRLNNDLKKFNQVDSYLFSVFKRVKLDLQKMEGLRVNDKVF